MSEPIPDAVAQAPSSAKSLILGALFASWPAFYYTLANTFCLPEMEVVSWIAIALVLIVCLATGISYAGTSKLRATTGAAEVGSLQQTVPDWPNAGWARIAECAAAGAGQLCHWIVPSIWLFLASSLGSYIVSTIWPQIPSGSIWILIPLAVVLAFGLSYIPSRGVADVGLPAICVIQAGLVIVFSITAVESYRAAHRPSKGPKYTEYYFDSTTGSSTPYLQDSTPDGRPKVDPQGDPVWVYDAVDANGDFRLDPTGKPIIVPTDDNGKLGALPPGAAQAVPAPFTIGEADTSTVIGNTFDYHTQGVTSAPAPFAIRYLLAMTLPTFLSVAIFQFIVSLGYRTKYKRPVVRSLAMLLLILVQCGGFYLVRRFTESGLAPPGFFLAASPSGPTPMGDLLVIFGTWAIGSYRAGWWLMLSQTSILLLVLIAAAWTCLDSRPGVAWMSSQQGPVSDHGTLAKRSQWCVLRRAGVTVLLCAIMLQQTYGNLVVNATAAAVPANTTAVPVLFSVLLSSVSLSTLVLCTLICLASLAAVRAHPLRKAAKFMIAPIIGLAAGLACIAAQLAGPFILGWRNDQELLWALQLCAVWGAGVVRQRVLRRRRTEQGQSYPLR